MTRWIEVGDEDSWDVRWEMKFVNGDNSVLESAKSRFCRRAAGTNCNCPEVGSARRLLRSKSWQNIDCACEPDDCLDACGILLSEM